MICHTHRSNFALALTTRQLDHGGQLDSLIENGLLKNGHNLKVERGMPIADPYNADANDLDTRARNYLGLNCSHCHRETGLGVRAGFQLLSKLKLEETGILNAPFLPSACSVVGKPALSPLATLSTRNPSTACAAAEPARCRCSALTSSTRKGSP